MNRKLRNLLFIGSLSFFIFFFSLQTASATISGGWDFTTHTLSDGAVGGAPNIFNFTDSTDTDAVAQTITVNVKSLMPGGQTRDSITMTALEVDLTQPYPPLTLAGTTGVYAINNIIFSPDTPRFSIGNTAVVTQQDATKANNGVVDTLTLSVISTTDPVGINFDVIETDANSGIFKGKLQFTSGPSVANTAIKVSRGDIVSVTNPSGNTENAVIVPSLDGTVNGLKTDVGDIIVASYNGVTTSIPATSIIAGGGGGGGAGGVVRPGLVLDVIAASVIGGNSPVAPPTFAIDIHEIDKLHLSPEMKSKMITDDPFKPILPLEKTKLNLPFYIGDKGFVTKNYANTIQTQEIPTGVLIPLKLNFMSYYPIIHLGIYTNVIGSGKELYDADTFFEYNKDAPLKITDPHHMFSNVTMSTIDDGTKHTFLFNVTFAKPTSRSDIFIRVWNDRHSSSDTKIFDAWKIVQNLNDTHLQKHDVLQNNVTLHPNENIKNNVTESVAHENMSSILKNNSSEDLLSKIKDWGGYSPTPISDSDLLKEFGINATHIPSWFIKTTKWYIENQTNSQDFVNVINFMYHQGMIK